MTDKDQIAVYPIGERTRYSRVHDALVDAYAKGHSRKDALHLGSDAQGTFIYISDGKSKAEPAEDRRGRAAARAAKAAEARRVKGERRMAVEALAQCLNNDFRTARYHTTVSKWTGEDIPKVHAALAKHYDERAKKKKIGPQEQRLSEIVADIHRLHAKDKKVTKHIGNWRGRACGTLRLESAIRREFQDHRALQGGRQIYKAGFSDKHLKKFIKQQLGGARLDGLTWDNLTKIKIALGRQGIHYTPHLDTLKDCLIAQHKYDHSYRSLISARVATLRQLAGNGTLRRAMMEADATQVPNAGRAIQSGTYQAVRSADKALTCLDGYMSKAGGLAGLKDQERKDARRLLADAATAIDTALSNMPATAAGNSLTWPLKELFATVVDLNRSLETPDERANLHREQTIVPHHLLEKHLTLSWFHVLDEPLKMPRTITMADERNLRVLEAGPRQGVEEIHTILWRKPGSSDATEPRSFASALKKYNRSLQDLAVSWHDFDGNQDRPQSDDKLATLKDDLDQALRANATMLAKLDKASARHSQETVEETYQDLLEDQVFGGKLGYIKKLLSRCCCGYCGPQDVDKAPLPGSHQEFVDDSRNAIAKMRKTVVAQRSALLALSKETTLVDLQRRAIARHYLGLGPRMAVGDLGMAADSYGKKRCDDYRVLQIMQGPADQSSEASGSGNGRKSGNGNAKIEEEDPLDEVPPLPSDDQPSGPGRPKVKRNASWSVYLASPPVGKDDDEAHDEVSPLPINIPNRMPSHLSRQSSSRSLSGRPTKVNRAGEYDPPQDGVDNNRRAAGGRWSWSGFNDDAASRPVTPTADHRKAYSEADDDARSVLNDQGDFRTPGSVTEQQLPADVPPDEFVIDGSDGESDVGTTPAGPDNHDDENPNESASLSLGGDVLPDAAAVVDDPQTFFETITDSEDANENDADEQRPVIESTITTDADANVKSKT